LAADTPSAIVHWSIPHSTVPVMVAIAASDQPTTSEPG